MSKQNKETGGEVRRKVQAERRTAAEQAEGGLAERTRTFWNFWKLWATAAEADADHDSRDDEEFIWNLRWIAFILIVLAGALLVAAGAYLAFGRSSDPTDALKTSGTTAGGAPMRWLIVADTPLYGERPQFTIELQGEGQSGEAVWLEPPQATGTYEWNGDDLAVKLVITQTAAEGVTFPQHFEIRMKIQPDGSLSGQLLSESWAYSLEDGLQIKGMEPWPAVGEPK